MFGGGDDGLKDSVDGGSGSDSAENNNLDEFTSIEAFFVVIVATR